MRKILSFVLVLSLVLGSFSMAFAADAVAKTVMSDVKGTSYEEAVTVLVDLGVITGYEDGTYKPEGTITRAEAAIVVIKALGMANSVGNTKSAFADMGGYGWAEPHIAFANKLGILTGYPDGTFKPGQTVSYNEFATMLVRALGYSDESLPGNWPANYVNKAAALSIMDNIKSAGAAGANRGDVAIMVKNNLGNYIGTVDKDNIWNATIKSGKGTEKDPYIYDTIIARLGGHFAEGVMDADMDSLINLMPYVGKYVEYYINDDDEVIAIAKVVSETIRGEFNFTNAYKEDYAKDLNKATNIEFEGDDDVDYKLSNADMADYTEFVNGEVSSIGKLAKDKTYTINVKLSGKKITDWYSAIEWKANDGIQVDEDDIAEIKDGELLGFDFETERNGDIRANTYELVGVNSLSDIKKDDVVYVYANKDDEIRRVAVGTEVVKGTITDADEDDGWKVDGKWYKATKEEKVDAEPIANNDYTTEVGNDVELILDAYGDIFDYEMITGSAKNYAVINGDNGGLKQVKLYAQDDSNKVYDTDLSGSKWTPLSNAISNKAADGISRIIGYGLNKSGQVDEVYTGTNAYTVGDTVTLISNKVIKTTSVGEYAIDKDVVVFSADGYENGTYSIDKVIKIEDIDKEKDAPNLAAGKIPPQILIRDKKVVAIVIDEKYSNASTDDTYAVISKRVASDNDGTKAYKVDGVTDAGKTFKSVLTTKQHQDLQSSNLFDKVRLFKIDYNSDGHISKVAEQSIVTSSPTATDNQVINKTKEATTKSDGYVVDQAGKKLAVSSSAVWIEATIKNSKVDDYTTFNGKIAENETVYLYETNDDKGHEGYDVVIVVRDSKGGSATAPTDTGKTIEFTAGSAVDTDVTTTVAAAGVLGVYNGSTQLVGGGSASDHYTAVNNAVRLRASYLNTLAVGTHTIKIETLNETVSVTVKVK